MPAWLNVSLAVLFLVHWLAFTALALRRKQAYYWLLSVLFLLLTSSFALRVLNPTLELAGQPLHQLTRYMAWALAAVTIPMLIIRMRTRRAGKQ